MPPMVKFDIVPALAAGILSGAACASAHRIVSTKRSDVSILPPATAAGGSASTTEPLGVISFKERRVPAVVGEPLGRRQRRTYKHAESVIARTALTLPLT